MKALRIFGSLLYHGFKLIQIFIYGRLSYCGFAGIDLDLTTGFVVLFLLFLPTLAIYIATFITSRSIGLLLKLIHSVIVLVMTVVITMIILREYDPFYGLIVAVFVVSSPVLIEGYVSFTSLKQLSMTTSDNPICGNWVAGKNVINMISKVLYHLFKVLQIVVYGLLAIDGLYKGLYDVYTGFMFLVLWLPAMAIYAISFRFEPRRVMPMKFRHGISALLLYLVGSVVAAYDAELNPLFWYAIGIAGILMIFVLIEGVVSFISMKRQFKHITDGPARGV